jgi:glutamate-1-semialdehyde aminotransferase
MTSPEQIGRSRLRPLLPRNGFYHPMVESGVWLPPSQYEAAFLGTAHTREDVEAAICSRAEALGRDP